MVYLIKKKKRKKKKQKKKSKASKHFILHIDKICNILYIPAAKMNLLEEIYTHSIMSASGKELDLSLCLVYHFCTVQILIYIDLIHNLPITAMSACYLFYPFDPLVHLSIGAFVWHGLLVGQCLNDGRCHISLGFSLWIPFHVSTGCCHQQQPSGKRPISLPVFSITHTAAVSSAWDISW